MRSTQAIGHGAPWSESQSTLWAPLTVLVLLIGAISYFHGIRGILPYHLDPDEPVYYISATEIRLTGRVRLNPLYPPLRFYELAGEQALADILAGGSASVTTYFILGRVVSAFASLLLLAVVYFIGHELHSRMAGFMSAALLFADGQIVHYSHLARGDPLAWLFGACVIGGTLLLLRRETWRIWLVTLVCSAGAVLAKYSMAPVLLLPGFLVLRRVIARSMWRWMAGGAIVIGTVGFVALVRAQAETWAIPLERAGFGFLTSDNFSFLTNARESLSEVRTGAGDRWLLLGFSVLPMLLLWGRARFSRAQLSLLALLWGVIAGTGSIFTFTVARYHDAYVAVLIWAIFSGIALALSVEKLRRVGSAVAIAVMAYLVWPKLVSAWEYGEFNTWPDTRAQTADWFIDHIPQGAKIITEYSGEFDSYSGFPGGPAYNAGVVDSLFAESLEQYRARGIEYLIADSRSKGRGGYFADPDRPGFADQLKLVAEFSPGPGILGPVRKVFRVPPYQQYERYAWIGDSISFRGFDISAITLHAGDRLGLTLYWMSVKHTDKAYTVFVHLIQPNTKSLAAQQDNPPLQGLQPTWTWNGDMQFFRDHYALAIRPDAPAGNYTLRIGLYDSATLQRLLWRDPQTGNSLGDHLDLGTINIVP